MKKSIALVLALAVMTSGLFAAKKEKKSKKTPAFKVAEMKKALCLSDSQVIEKKGIPESEKAYDAAVDLAEQGCTYIIATSFGHESYLIQAAKEYPKIVFAHATGYQAAMSGLKNMHNFMPSIYQARYVSGIVAGLKLNEMIASKKIKASEAKIGYVGAYPYAEVVSGYTSFFLGARSVCPSATMEVRYTNSWADMSLEKETAEALIAAKCVLISQHADTTGAPSACQAHGVPCVGYNVDMTAVAPDSALTSAAMNWGAFYTLSAKAVMNGQGFDVEWSKGYEEDAVYITKINSKVATSDAQAKTEAAEKAIKAGTLKVFNTKSFTVNGKSIEDLIKAGGDFAKYSNYVKDGAFNEQNGFAAPAFDLRIDGIVER